MHTTNDAFSSHRRPRFHRRPTRAALAAAVLIQSGGCSRPHPVGLIRNTLQTQADAWNDGDIERFMRDYVHSEELTFVSDGDIHRGWNAACERYRTRYPDRSAMGRLTFSELEVRMLGRQAALVVGRWRVDRDVRPVAGRFTLVMEIRAGRWRIVHDHTSTDRDPVPTLPAG